MPVCTQNSTIVLERVACVSQIHIYLCKMFCGRIEVPDEIPEVLIVRHHVDMSVGREDSVVEPCQESRRTRKRNVYQGEAFCYRVEIADAWTVSWHHVDATIWSLCTRAELDVVSDNRADVNHREACAPRIQITNVVFVPGHEVDVTIVRQDSRMILIVSTYGWWYVANVHDRKVSRHGVQHAYIVGVLRYQIDVSVSRANTAAVSKSGRACPDCRKVQQRWIEVANVWRVLRHHVDVAALIVVYPRLILAVQSDHFRDVNGREGGARSKPLAHLRKYKNHC
jgi:hypothetical protein